jgi:hypothetical protein
MQKSEVIFKNAHYTACAMRDGSLIVTRNKGNGGGSRLIGSNAASWIDAIRTAIDSREASSICRAVVIGDK